MHYMTSAFYAPHAAAGVRFDDPAFAIAWPFPVAEISEQDRDWPLVRRGSRERSRPVLMSAE
jgi:dTDP-4-dehydrorhamnose 3,5-epimerase